MARNGHRLLAGFLLNLILFSFGWAAQINLVWNPDSSPDVAGYKIYYGTSPRNGTDPKSCGTCGYQSIKQVGNLTSDTVGDLVTGQTYYFSVTAYDALDNESFFSNEVSGTVTDRSPNNPSPDNPSNGSLVITPSTGFSSSGSQRGAFTPSSQAYTLQNMSANSVKWRVSNKPAWLSVTPMSGTLAPNRTTQLRIATNTSTRALNPGSYSDTVVMSNTSITGDAVSLSVSIDITAPTKSLTVRTNPAGLQVIVDGVTITAPQTFKWTVNSSHTLDIPSPQTDGAGRSYVFSSWSNRQSQSQTFIAPSAGSSIVATFRPAKLSSTTSPASVGSNSNSPAVPSNSQNTSAQTNLPQTNVLHSNLPLIGALESPSDGKKVWGFKTIYGWALDGQGISKVELFIDGHYICDIPYGGLVEGLKDAYPGYPTGDKGGFALVWNYSSLPSGTHSLRIQIQNLKGESLDFNANFTVPQIPGAVITQVSPNQWTIPGANITLDGKGRTSDLTLEWSEESQSFEIINLLP